MKALILILMTIHVSSLFAETAKHDFFDFNQKKFTFEESNENVIIYNQCEKHPCLSEKIKLPMSENFQNNNGIDPALLVCIDALHGHPMQMHDGKNNEESVCVFTDGSMITFGSIR